MTPQRLTDAETTALITGATRDQVLHLSFGASVVLLAEAGNEWAHDLLSELRSKETPS